MKLGDQRTFQHTSIAAYLLATAALCCLFYDSTKVGTVSRPAEVTLNRSWCADAVGFLCQLCSQRTLQGVLQRYELNKKWYYLWGVTCFFAYLYIRPLIRRGIGSASRCNRAASLAYCYLHNLPYI